MTFRSEYENVKTRSSTGTKITKVSKWFNGASVFDVLGPLTDTITIGLNIWGLDIAIRDGDDAGIAAASLSWSYSWGNSRNCCYVNRTVRRARLR